MPFLSLFLYSPPMALPAESEKRILSVGELSRRLKRAIEDGVPYVWVCGEISNYRGPGPSGHLYFTLKDQESQIPCAMWRGFAAKLKVPPENGMEVVAGGRVEVYVPHGKYQLIVEQMEPRGVGALQVRFEQLKEKLQKEGLFDAARKRPLPFLPRKIVLVTSPTGAAVQDMLRTLRSRCPAVDILVYPVKVQGDGAAQEVAAAIGHVNLAMPDVDLLLVGRGGGSIEDLWAFNEEAVARAIYASRIPVISAVGHETDTTIADFVADVRALTPTDGAQRAVPKLDDLLLALADQGTKLKRAVSNRAALARAALDGLAGGRDLGRVEELPDQLAQRLDDLQGRLVAAAGQAPSLIRERLDRLGAALGADLPRAAEAARRTSDHLSERLGSHVARALERSTADVRHLDASLQALSPVSILGRGYSITYREGRIVKDAKEVKKGDRLRTRLGQGELDSTAG